ncbi:hypothetical protein VIBHAR_06308 [Vibrio campbellii ATCC BAA-1116]|uniref:Uncharacterized protein n=1 Tax=Vibrio campbellii (strain ATCC BAA-1116) TaxID=2902295 RepID=A7N1Y6_VIBC1|nr:hypothetical protein VIBHAR_06308 [Vibrio campbellii ATCC BAA-1116]
MFLFSCLCSEYIPIHRPRPQHLTAHFDSSVSKLN